MLMFMVMLMPIVNSLVLCSVDRTSQHCLLKEYQPRCLLFKSSIFLIKKSVFFCFKRIKICVYYLLNKIIEIQCIEVEINQLLKKIVLLELLRLGKLRIGLIRLA